MVDFEPGVTFTSNGIKNPTKSEETEKSYDNNENSVSIWTKKEKYDYDGDGKVDEILCQKYDQNNQLIDSNRCYFRYDTSGRTTYEGTDIGDDGSMDREIIWEYDELGRVIKSTYKEKDKITTQSVQYTNQGEIIDEDTDGDGTTDIRIVRTKDKTTTYKKDNEGNLSYDSESRYGRDKNGAIIADHYSKYGYTGSSGPDAYKHKKGFGL